MPFHRYRNLSAQSNGSASEKVPADQYRPGAANGIHTGLRTQHRPEKDVRRNKPKRNPIRELSSLATGFRIHRILHPPESAVQPHNPIRTIALSRQKRTPTDCPAGFFQKPADFSNRKTRRTERPRSARMH